MAELCSSWVIAPRDCTRTFNLSLGIICVAIPEWLWKRNDWLALLEEVRKEKRETRTVNPNPAYAFQWGARKCQFRQAIVPGCEWTRNQAQNPSLKIEEEWIRLLTSNGPDVPLTYFRHSEYCLLRGNFKGIRMECKCCTGPHYDIVWV